MSITAEHSREIGLEHLSFSGHETFPLRYLWLTKGLRSAEQHSNAFKREDALSNLGVGKNMVGAIRHYAQAASIVDRSDNPTTLGQKLLSEGGWDPYLEDLGTIWLIHWQIVSNPVKASTWQIAFTRWGRESFIKDDLVTYLSELVFGLGHKVSVNSLKRDADVFIRCYLSGEPDKRRPSEDTFDSPLADLGLLTEVERGIYSFNQGANATLPDAILSYAIKTYWLATNASATTISFANILHGLSSPGGAFKLSSNALALRLEQLDQAFGLTFDDTAGLKQIVRSSDLEPFDDLAIYYEGLA